MASLRGEIGLRVPNLHERSAVSQAACVERVLEVDESCLAPVRRPGVSTQSKYCMLSIYHYIWHG